jgi:hypothetical protein
MLPLGHMGIGSKLVGPWTRELPKGMLLLGTLVPDLVDKPLYYGLSLMTGLHGSELGLISCTRTFGHTALFLLVVTIVAVWRRSLPLAALALGMATHLLLDNFADTFESLFASGPPEERSALIALLWPVYKARFSIAPFTDLSGHLSRSLNPFLIGSELVGAAILGWDWWKNRHESEIMQMLQWRRRHKKELKRKSRRFVREES